MKMGEVNRLQIYLEIGSGELGHWLHVGSGKMEHSEVTLMFLSELTRRVQYVLKYWKTERDMDLEWGDQEFSLSGWGTDVHAVSSEATQWAVIHVDLQLRREAWAEMHSVIRDYGCDLEWSTEDMVPEIYQGPSSTEGMNL